MIAKALALLAWMAAIAPSLSAEPPFVAEPPPPQTLTVRATAYTCDTHPANPMHPCGPLRWGGSVQDAGMACPASWRDETYRVEGFGVLRCDDTPRDESLNGLPHIDLRLASYEAAVQWGIRTIEIVRVP